MESHYFEFNPSQPAWKYFDVSSCMRDLEKLYLKLTLDGDWKTFLKSIPCLGIKMSPFCIVVSYSQLVQFSLQRAHDSIRKAIASITKVSPLRISDLHVSCDSLLS